jgi:hypothetical protein
LWNPARIAPSDLLVEEFEQLVFHGSRGQSYSDVSKWQGPMRVVLRGTGGEPYIPDVQRYLATIAQIAGFEAQLSSEHEANVFIHFARLDSFYEVGALYGEKGESWRAALSGADCITGSFQGGQYVLIPSDRRKQYTASCILHELFHAVGFSGHSALVPGSIANVDDHQVPTALSIGDKVLLRALYDARIEDGMEKARAMPLAEAVIRELAWRVKTEGERVLTQRQRSRMPSSESSGR